MQLKQLHDIDWGAQDAWLSVPVYPNQCHVTDMLVHALSSPII